MTGKAKPKKHTAKEIAAKIDAATTNRGGGKVGQADRLGQDKGGHAKLACPLLLFHARDDSNVPVQESIDCADRLKALGKPVTLEVVPTGDHYRGMLAQGIPRAIAWLKAPPGAAP